MYQEVKIGDKFVPMKAMASVDYFYEQIFHEDPIKLQSQENFDTGELLKLIEKMGFVMAKFAETDNYSEMSKLTMKDFLEWLNGFRRSDYMEALLDIKSVYDGQTITYSEAKKNSEEPTDK